MSVSRSVDGGRRDLLAGIHATRRPLGLIRGYLQMLRDESLGPLSDGQKAALGRIEEKVLEASTQLDRIDAASRLESRALEIEDVVLEDEVRRAGARAAAKVELRGARLDLDLDGTNVARADRALLAQVLDNLIDNALTYSVGPSRVTIQVGSSPDPWVRVTDRGIGVAAAGGAQIFDRGYRAHPADERWPGSGLGLYLSRRSTEEMGGSLVLETSRPHAGSTFRIGFLRGGA